MSGWLEGTPLAAIPDAVFAGLVSGALLPLLGAWIVLQRVVFLGVTLAQVAAAGVALGLVLHLPPLPVGLVLTLLVVAGVTRAGTGRIGARGDSTLGATFCVASALSLLFISRSPADMDQVHHVLHGNLIYAAPEQASLVAWTLLAGLAVIAAFSKQLLFAAFDAETATAVGVATRRWLMLLFGVLAAALSVSMRTTGSLLTFAMLVLPPLAALQVATSMRSLFALSGTMGLAATLAGFFVAVGADLHLESSITVTLFALLPIAAAWKRGPLVGASATAAAIAGVGILLSTPAAPPESAGHHHDAGPLRADEPYHFDLHLSARQPPASGELSIQWTLDVQRQDQNGVLPPALWVVLTGDGLVHEHEILHKTDELPVGASRHTGAFVLEVTEDVRHLEGQLWTGPTESLEALPLDVEAASVFGCDVQR